MVWVHDQWWSLSLSPKAVDGPALVRREAVQRSRLEDGDADLRERADALREGVTALVTKSKLAAEAGAERVGRAGGGEDEAMLLPRRNINGALAQQRSDETRPPQGRRIAVAELPRLAKSKAEAVPRLGERECVQRVGCDGDDFLALACGSTGTRVGGTRE